MESCSPRMSRMCAWCGAKSDDSDQGDGPGRVVTHGACEKCAFRLNAQLGLPLSEYLDGLDAPIVLLGGGGDVRGANARARAILGKEVPTIAGRLGGDVFECRYASLPEGCGRTVHCSGCTIRNTVTDTHTTGRSHLHEPASLDQGTPEEPRSVDLLISTERVGDVVLLRIDEMRPHGKGVAGE